MRNTILSVALCLVSLNAFAAAASSSSYPNGDRTISTAIPGHVLYRSRNGAIDIQMTKEGMKIGDFSLKATNVSREGEVIKFHVIIEYGSNRVEDDLIANEKTNELRGRQMSRVNEIARSFALSEDGQLLQEAKELIVSSRAQTSNRNTVAGGRLSPHATWNGWGCTADVLNAVAGGAAMIGGCGTPACGTAYTWCCVSGATWYASGLIQIANSGDCVFL
jgi:hypothetical protein